VFYKAHNGQPDENPTGAHGARRDGFGEITMEKNAIITIGLPGCGKSTWAAKKALNFRIIERDLIRSKICEDLGIEFSWDTWDTRLETRVTELWEREVNAAISDGSDVCLSDTNLNPKYRVSLAERLIKAGYGVTYVLFDVHPLVCQERNNLRGPKAVDNIAYKRLVPLFKEAKNNIEQECSRLGSNLLRL
jgi:predicted kinase